MDNSSSTIELIHIAFRDNEYPGDAYLQGSFEGEEPFAEVEPFKGQNDWTQLHPDFLDAHPGALSFFTEAAFRFYLPAYIGPRGWIALRLDIGKVDWTEVAELVRTSYRLIHGARKR